MKGARFEPRHLWRDDGHLSDLVLTALADGQDSLVPTDIHEHAATCESCSARLGALALRSLEVDDALQSHAGAALSRPPAVGFKLPVVAFAAAFVLASLGSIPRLLELYRTLGEARGSPLDAGLILVKSAALLFRSANQQDTLAVTLAWCASALAILALGAIVARLAPPGTMQRNDNGSHD
jgi:hypothetical protein